jgi:hypothetical protein
MNGPRLILQVPLLAALAIGPTSTAAQVPAPQDVIGFTLGSDYELANYDQVLAYFQALAEASDRVVLEEIGRSTLGKPMVLAFISTPENLGKRARYREINRRLALAKGLADDEAQALAAEGVATVWIDGGLHATEVAHSQHTPELAYWLATDESAEARRVRENTLVLLMPNINPDGANIVVDWYRENLGTPFETAPVPELYHPYVGHDNNRDWYMFTQAETQVAANVFYHEWFPQIIYNHHQTGPFPGRIWVPPPADPLNEHYDPLIVASFSHLGQYMLARFMKEGKPGVSTGIGYRVVWSAGFMHATPQLHNMLGLFTETALYRYATPHCYSDEEVGDIFTRGIRLSTREPSMHYIVPWEGGCWHLRDAMDYMMTGSRAVLDLAAKLKDDYLYNIYHMGQRQIRRGERAEGGPFAYIIDVRAQHDPGGAVELLRIFRQAGIEVRRAENSFAAGGARYPAGTYVIPPQAFRPFVVDLLEPKQHPDRFEYPGGPPEPPYDLTGYNLADQLGVVVERVFEPFALPGPAMQDIPAPSGTVSGRGGFGYVYSHKPNWSALATNRLLKAGASVSWTKDPVTVNGEEWPAGTFLVRGAGADGLADLSRELGIDFVGTDADPGVPTSSLRAPRVGIYQSYVANMAEGWTRWVLDQYEFDVEPIHDEDVRSGNLNRFDAILLPDQTADGILNGHPALTMPEQYVGGVSVEGGAALKRYVERGGWLLGFHQSVEFITSTFGLPVRNAVADIEPRHFFIPGSLIRFTTDPSHPLAYGMPEEGVALFWRHGVAMQVLPAASESSSAAGEQRLDQNLNVFASFPEDSLLIDGWAIGAKRYLGGRPAALQAPVGDGAVVLIGFRPDTRGQPRNAFKLLFNPLFASTIRELVP